jgi:hypothetical protein
MLIRRITWLVCGLLALVALGLSWRAFTNPASVVTVEWTTASELNTAGFNLYRGDSQGGPFTKINRDFIPHSPDPLVGGSYVFTDTTVLAGRTYYYQLEDVEFSGGSNRHGPIVVKAERGGTTELTVAVALMAAAILGLVILTTSKR